MSEWVGSEVRSKLCSKYLMDNGSSLLSARQSERLIITTTMMCYSTWITTKLPWKEEEEEEEEEECGRQASNLDLCRINIFISTNTYMNIHDALLIVLFDSVLPSCTTPTSDDIYILVSSLDPSNLVSSSTSTRPQPPMYAPSVLDTTEEERDWRLGEREEDGEGKRRGDDGQIRNRGLRLSRS